MLDACLLIKNRAGEGGKADAPLVKYDVRFANSIPEDPPTPIL